MTKLQHESDLTNPKERFAWAFRGLEYSGFPMLFPDKVLEVWSEHLSQCGFVHVSELEAAAEADGRVSKDFFEDRQVIHYQPPIRGQNHGLNGAGEWVPVEQPLKVPAVPVSSQLTAQEKAKLINEFKEEGLID